MQIIKGKIKDNLFVYNAVDYNHTKGQNSPIAFWNLIHSFTHSTDIYTPNIC